MKEEAVSGSDGAERGSVVCRRGGEALVVLWFQQSGGRMELSSDTQKVKTSAELQRSEVRGALRL